MLRCYHVKGWFLGISTTSGCSWRKDLLQRHNDEGEDHEDGQESWLRIVRTQDSQDLDDIYLSLCHLVLFLVLLFGLCKVEDKDDGRKQDGEEPAQTYGPGEFGELGGSGEVKLRRGKNRQAFLNSTHSASSSARPSTSMSRVKLLMSQDALILSFQFLMFDWEGAVLARVKGRSGSNQNWPKVRWVGERERIDENMAI